MAAALRAWRGSGLHTQEGKDLGDLMGAPAAAGLTVKVSHRFG